MISPVLLLLLSAWGYVLWMTAGLYREVWVGFFPMLWLVPFIDWSPWLGRVTRETSTRLCLCVAAVFCGCLVWFPLVMYAEGSNLNYRFAVGLAGASFLVAGGFRRNRVASVVVGLIAVAASLAFVLPLSPHPYIDVWSYTRQAIEACRQGVNPYSMSYPAMYEGVIGHFPYPPLVIFGLAPFEIMFADVRWGYWFYLLVSAGTLGWFLQRRLGTEIALAASALFLTFPITPFVLEQSWTDPFSLALLFVSVAFFDRGFRKLALICLGAFAASKQYDLLIAVPLYVMKYERKTAIRDLFLASLIPVLSFLPFLIWDSSALMASLTEVPVMKQAIFFSLQNWMVHRSLELSDRWALFSTALFALVLVLKRSTSLVALSALFLWLLLFYSHTAANYLWLGMFGFWLSICEKVRARIDLEWGLFLLSRLMILFVLLPHLTDLPAYFEHARDMVDRDLGPYLDLKLEYPPGSLPFFIFPHWFERWLFTDNFMAYRFAYHLMMLAIDALFFRSLRKYFSDFKTPIFLYLCLTSLLGALLYDRFDLIIAVAMGWALIAIARGSFGQGALAIGAGTVAKFVPVLWTPLLLLVAWERRAKPKKLVGLLSFCLLPMTFAVTWVYVSSGDVSFLTYHAKRGIQIESLFGAAILFAKVCGGWAREVGMAVSFGAVHLTGVEDFKPFAVAAFAFAMALVLIWVLANSKRVAFSVLAWTLLLAFVLFNRVFSPQFMIWLVVVGCFVVADLRSERRLAWLALFGGTVLLTAAVFYFYAELEKGDAVVLTALNLRNVLLLLLLPLTIRWGRKISNPNDLVH